MSDLVNAGVVKQKDENSFVVQGPDGELNFDYVERWTHLVASAQQRREIRIFPVSLPARTDLRGQQDSVN